MRPLVPLLIAAAALSGCLNDFAAVTLNPRDVAVAVEPDDAVVADEPVALTAKRHLAYESGWPLDAAATLHVQ